MDNEWIRVSDAGTPTITQEWNFQTHFFVSGDERLNLDLTEVRNIEVQPVARFYYATTLN